MAWLRSGRRAPCCPGPSPEPTCARQKLLHLSHKYGPHGVDHTCQRALAFALLNVHCVERIVLDGLAPTVPPSAPTSRIVPLAARFMRPAG